MTKEKVSETEVSKALQFLDKFSKSKDSTPLVKESTIEGSEVNGGDSKDNPLTAKEKLEMKKAQIAKLKEEIEEIEKSEKKLEKEDLEEEIKVEDAPEIDDEDLEVEEEDEDKEDIKKALVSISTILGESHTREKSLDSRMDSFEKSLKDISDLLGEVSLGRKSARNVATLQKGFGAEEQPQRISKSLNINIPTQKQAISNLLMKSFNENPEDRELENAIVAFETSGYLEPKLVKSLEQKNNIQILM